SGIASLRPARASIRNGRDQLDHYFVGERRSQCAVEQRRLHRSRPQRIGSNQAGAASHFLLVRSKRVDVYTDVAVDVVLGGAIVLTRSQDSGCGSASVGNVDYSVAAVDQVGHIPNLERLDGGDYRNIIENPREAVVAKRNSSWVEGPVATAVKVWS